MIISRVSGEVSASKFTHIAVRDLSSLPHRPLYRAVHNTAACFPKEEWEWQAKQSHRSLVNYSEVTSHHICPTLFIRKESLGPAHIKWEEFKQRLEYGEVRTTGNHFKGCLPHWVYIPEISNRSIIKQGQSYSLLQYCVKDSCGQLRCPSTGKQMRGENVIYKHMEKYYAMRKQWTKFICGNMDPL